MKAPAILLGLAVIALALVAMGFPQTANFGDPLPGLTADQQALFVAGQATFAQVEDVPSGLGPVFNDTGCVKCHNQPATGGGSDTLETRFGSVANGVFDPLVNLGGSLIQRQGIGMFNGVNFVGEVVPPQANVMAQRRTTPLFGLGLVDAVSDDTLSNIAQAEQWFTPDTAGRVNVVTDVASGQQRAGRFGWKCQNATLLTFAGDAYLNEMGITTPMFPIENCPQGNCALLSANPALNNPNDVDNSSVQQFANFMTLLGPPPRGPHTDQSRAGARLFFTIGCVNCHLPVLQTGPNQVAALDQVKFFPFSDFLLHDMGSLGDGIEQSGAGQREMRTAPLWGVRAVTSFLHDGRAATLDAAILAHDGQGRQARDQFANLSDDDRASLIAFLNSL
jgi:CxxC motif-containing protein (DUF1111 family)